VKQYGGWYFPDHEEHLPEWLKKNGILVDGRLAYQYKKLQAALRWVRSWRAAIDVGAHVGLWSFYLAQKFGHVIAFEPVADHRECFIKNVTATNVSLCECALGCPDEEGTIGIYTRPGSSGDSWVKGKGDIPLRRMDEVVDNDDIDFIKLDCEGFELFALQGGQELIKRCRPTIIVEQKPGKAQTFGLGETDAVKYLEGLGYRLREHLSGDYILTRD
jgi:FkbM family methyltransferase